MASNKHIVVFSGAGMSAESGIRTFRGKGGLWEKFRPEELASPEAWQKNPEKVLAFYNERRKQLNKALPNAGHKALAALEKDYPVTIITQNIDDLHERAGSTKVVHLHGELKKARSNIDPNLVYEIKGDEINIGDRCEKGSQLRPHVVWFGEPVMAMENALRIIQTADYFIIVGTSLSVYPAAGLVLDVPEKAVIFLVNPEKPEMNMQQKFEWIPENASEGLPKVIDKINNEEKNFV